MKIRSVKSNYILNVFRLASATLIGIVTMPYVNKVLGAESLGKVEYVNTIINYFLLFSALGIPVYGIREIARVRDDIKQRTKTVIELLIILGFTSIISYALLFGVLYQLDFFQNYKDLILLLSSIILLSNLGAEWYFQGIEDQLYITVRYVAVRIISLCLLFYLVKSKDDYLLYALILVLISCGSNFFNLIYIFKTINFKLLKFSDLEFKKHLKPIMTIFIAAVSINIYLQLDFFLIGTIVGNKYVGFYSVANKLIRYAILFITAIGAVLIPRLSNLISKNRDEYNVLTSKAFNYILLISIPFTIFFLMFSNDIIFLMAGEDFKDSILTMQLLSPLCIIVGIAYFLGYLVLYPQGKEIVYTKAVLVSAVFSVLINYFAIIKFQQNGAAVVSVIAELMAITIMYLYAKKEIKELNLINNLWKYMVASVIMISVLWFISFFNISILFRLLFLILTSFLFFYWNASRRPIN